MKFITLCLTVFVLVANPIVFKTSNPNLGFGLSSECSTNTYFDFCVNGPLVGSDGLPLGGYIDNFHQKKDWIDPKQGGGNFAVTNGIFGLDAQGRLRMCSYTDRNSLPQMNWAFQNGPILVQDGKNIRGTSDSRFARSGIGFTSDNQIIVLVSEDQVTFREFAELFVEAGCVSAMYLDGGPYVGWSNNQSRSGMVDGAIKLQFYNN